MDQWERSPRDQGRWHATGSAPLDLTPTTAPNVVSRPTASGDRETLPGQSGWRSRATAPCALGARAAPATRARDLLV